MNTLNPADLLRIFAERLESNRREVSEATQRALTGRGLDIQEAGGRALAKHYGALEQQGVAASDLARQQFLETQAQNQAGNEQTRAQNLISILTGQGQGVLQPGPAGGPSVPIPGGGLMPVAAVPLRDQIMNRARAQTEAKLDELEEAAEQREKWLDTFGVKSLTTPERTEWILGGKMPQNQTMENAFTQQYQAAVASGDKTTQKTLKEEWLRMQAQRAAYGNPLRMTQLNAQQAAAKAARQAILEYMATHAGKGPQTPADEQAVANRARELMPEDPDLIPGAFSMGVGNLRQTMILPKEQEDTAQRLMERVIARGTSPPR